MTNASHLIRKDPSPRIDLQPVAILKTALLLFALVLVLQTTLCAASARDSSRKPNIVLILADDLGWMDTSVYGSSFYQTPNIDDLAKRGMLFSNAYSAAPLCSASRASIMSGQYAARTTFMTAAGHLPEVRLRAAALEGGNPAYCAAAMKDATRLDTKIWTIAESLKAAGYTTGHFGKWHIGPEPYSPLQQGFDVDVPHYPGPGPAGSYQAPWRFPKKLHFTGVPGENIEDRMAKEAVKFIRANKDHPFYLNYWTFSVHGPWDGKPELIEKYRKLADPNKAQHTPIMAAMVETLDRAVGTLVAELKKQGIYNNTLIVFTSDNGGNMYSPINGDTGKRMGSEDGRTPKGKNWVYPTNNAPLRGGKATIYEGGSRVPCIVVWPGVVKSASQSNALITGTDLYPTLIQAGGGVRHSDQPMDGASLIPLLTGKASSVRDSVMIHFPFNMPATGNIASTYLRRGDWVLIRDYFSNPDHSDRYELYNLISDPGEAHDVAAKNSGIVADLRSRMDKLLSDTHAVLPKPNPKYDSSKKPVRPVMGPPIPAGVHAPFIGLSPPLSGTTQSP